MKETKGLSEKEVKNLYVPQNLKESLVEEDQSTSIRLINAWSENHQI